MRAEPEHGPVLRVEGVVEAHSAERGELPRLWRGRAGAAAADPHVSRGGAHARRYSIDSRGTAERRRRGIETKARGAERGNRKASGTPAGDRAALERNGSDQEIDDGDEREVG